MKKSHKRNKMFGFKRENTILKINKYYLLSGSYVHDLIKYQGKICQQLGINRQVDAMSTKVEVTNVLLGIWKDQKLRTHNMMYFIHRNMEGSRKNI